MCRGRELSASEAAALLDVGSGGTHWPPMRQRQDTLRGAFIKKQPRRGLALPWQHSHSSVLESSACANAESFKKRFHPHSLVVCGLLLRELNKENEVNELSFINNRRSPLSVENNETELSS